MLILSREGLLLVKLVVLILNSQTLSLDRMIELCSLKNLLVFQKCD